MQNLKLVVVDSVSDLYSFEYKQSMGAEKHLKFMRFMHELALSAINCSVAVLVTNSVRYTGIEQVQQLDRSISNFAHFKVGLSKYNDVFKAQLFQPSLERKEAFFRVSDKGIMDA